VLVLKDYDPDEFKNILADLYYFDKVKEEEEFMCKKHDYQMSDLKEFKAIFKVHSTAVLYEMRHIGNHFDAIDNLAALTWDERDSILR